MPGEAILRVGVFAGLLLLFLVLEQVLPKRTPVPGRWGARGHNLLLVGFDTLCLRLFIPLAAAGSAEWAATQGWGLSHWLGWPIWLAGVVSFLVLDLVIYAQHVVFHKVPWLWRLHRVHHTDTAIDATTGVRFHPFEILLSMLLKMATVLLLGAPVVAVIVFEVVLNATSLFNHANINLPVGVDRWLRRFVVTPDMHRVHHSVERVETDSNFGFNLPWWDWLFGTYRDQPRAGHDRMTIGLEIFRDRRSRGLHWLLVQPFLSTAASARRREPSTTVRETQTHDGTDY